MNIVRSMQLSLVLPKSNSEICAYWNLYSAELGIPYPSSPLKNEGFVFRQEVFLSL